MAERSASSCNPLPATARKALEDDYASEFRYGGRALASLQGLDDGERVIYVGKLNNGGPGAIRRLSARQMRINRKETNLDFVEFGLHGGGGMANLLDCRAQEALCRIHALTGEQHRDLWLSMAERWSYLARQEIAAFGLGDAKPVPRSAKDQGKAG